MSTSEEITAITDQNISAVTGEEIPMRATLASQMGVEITVNEKSDVWLLHDAAFSDIIRWAEYDVFENKISLVTINGAYHELGIVIPDVMRDLIREADQLFAVYLDGENVKDIYILPLIVQQFGMA